MPPADTVTDRRRLGATQRALAAVAALVAVGILVAGCGGGSKSPGVANVTTTSTTSSHTSSTSTTNGGSALGGGAPATGSGGGGPRSGFAIATGNPQKALKLSECMRAHGVPNFPDPNGQGVIQGSGFDPNSSQFQKAQQTCAKALGHGLGTRSPAQIAQAEAAALAFSKCMRSHGVPGFPDPTFGSGGGISIRITGHAGAGGNNGLDPSSPIFQKAQRSCGSLLPGRAGGKTLAP
jgi:hypothetical protein